MTHFYIYLFKVQCLSYRILCRHLMVVIKLKIALIILKLTRGQGQAENECEIRKKGLKMHVRKKRENLI